MKVNEENPLGSEKISRLLHDFALPSIIAMLVGALYNIVDQFFIGRSVGMYGNAATNVALPLTTVCTAVSYTHLVISLLTANVLISLPLW